MTIVFNIKDVISNGTVTNKQFVSAQFLTIHVQECRDVVSVSTSRYVQGHPRSSIGANRKRICSFLLVISSNFGGISYRFRDIDA